MYSNGKHLDELDLSVLRAWREARTEESRTLDFKRDAYALDARQDAPRRDFAADVCGFANAGGGLILLGVDEERDESGQHAARFGEIAGVDLPVGFASCQQRAEAVARELIEPRGIALRLREVATDDPARPVIALGVERSTRAPHRLRLYGSTDFFVRSLRVVERMDVDQIREAFRRTFTVLDDAERQLEEAERRAALTPTEEPFFWAAITPTFPASFQYPPRDRRLHELLAQLGRLRLDLPSHSIGYDVHGAFLFTGGSAGRGTPLFRIHRDGSLERTEPLRIATIDREPRSLGAGLNIIPTARFIVSAHFAQVIAHTYKNFEEVREALGITGPAVLSAAVCAAAGYELDPLIPYGGRSREKSSPTPKDHAVLLQPRLETSDETLRVTFKNVADFFWNVWGYVECSAFDDEGFPTQVFASWEER